MMKRTFAIFISLLLLISCVAPCFAHPGSLDEDGGHWNHSTGEYHYHDGKHTTGSSSGSSSSSDSSYKSSSNPDIGFGGILAIVMLIGLVLLIVWSRISSSSHYAPPEHSEAQPHKQPSPQPKPKEDLKLLPPPPTPPPLFVSPRAKVILESLVVARKLPKPNSSFFTPEAAQAFKESLLTERLNRAKKESFSFSDVVFDYDASPIQISCTLKTQADHTYSTSLAQCSCEDNIKRRIVCKHMIALASWCGAVTDRAFSLSHILNAFLCPDEDISFLALHKINADYCLELSDDDIVQILDSDSPCDVLEEFVPFGSPSFDQLFDQFIRTIHKVYQRVSAPIDLSDDTEETVIAFAKDCACILLDAYTLAPSDCPTNMPFMVGKVNYYSASLACLYAFARYIQNEQLKDRIKETYQSRTTII